MPRMKPAAATVFFSIFLCLPLYSQSPTNVSPAAAQAESDNPESDSQPVRAFRTAVRHLLENEKFEELEAIATKARSQKERFLGGAWKLNVFYSTVQGPGSLTSTDAVWTAHMELLKRWIAAKPESITPRVALAQAYLRFAWKARGRGYSNTVTQDGWKLFSERIEQAKQTLEQAETVAAKDAQWYRAMQTVALAQGWQREQADNLLQKAAELEPDYFYVYAAHANYLLPKWYGKPGDTETFVQSSADRIAGPQGNLVYFEVAMDVNCCRAKPQANLSWSRVKEGFAALEELYGSTNHELNAMAFMAARQNDSEFAKQVFSRIGDNWDEEIWGSKVKFDRAKASLSLTPEPENQSVGK
jgi:hypothetical protein